MTETYPDAGSFFAALADKAETLRQTLVSMNSEERSRFVPHLIVSTTMVFGVWEDEREATGFGIQIIKGEDMIAPLAGFEMPDDFTVAAIPCVSYDQAAAARDAWMRYVHLQETRSKDRPEPAAAEARRSA